MTQSPPKAPTSSRPPAAQSSVDAGRRVTALAAGGAVLLLSGTAVALWPRTYGTEATFALESDATVQNPVAFASRVEAALLEREELASAAMDLPPELRSPDPIGRLRAGIRVQSRGARSFSVEFRGSDPESVRRIANRLVDRAVASLPKIAAAAAAKDQRPDLELVAKTRAVTEFLTAHPEVTLEPPVAGAKPSASPDRGLEALRYEKRQIEQRLATPGSNDNPYADPSQDPALLSLRLAEIKATIAKRETALKQPSAPQLSAELTGQWRTLLADLAVAQGRALSAPAAAPVKGHVVTRAPLPTSPLTPNRLVLSIVAALLTLAAAMVAYVLPRRPAPRPARAPGGRSDPPPPRPASEPPPAQPVAAQASPTPSAAPPAAPFADKRSDPPPARAGGSEPPGPIVVQRTVVLTGHSNPPPATEARRSHTDPGGLQAPTEVVGSVSNPAPAPLRPSQAPPGGLFGARPAPGAGSYSVSSSHPPPMEGGGGPRTTIERLSPLQSAHPPPAAATVATRSTPAPQPDAPPATQPIVSRPPALDPEAERWAARFETVPPPAGPAPGTAPAEEPAARKRSSRWKTQVMGSMVPLEVSAAREEREPMSEPASRPLSEPPPLVVAARAAAQAPSPSASTLIHHDVPAGWRPPVEFETPELGALRDAVLAHRAARHLCVVATGAGGARRAQLAAGLALSLSLQGVRVLLAEADFDAPDLHLTLDVTPPPGGGFSQQLNARQLNSQDRPWQVLRCAPRLHVLVEGRMRSPGMSTAAAFERALVDLREQHDVVILHAPPQQRLSDMSKLRTVAQAVLLAPAQGPASIEFGEAALRSLG